MAAFGMGACGCQRGMWCCEACKLVRRALEDEFHNAMTTGAWDEFDKIRHEFEEHMRGEPNGNE
jgi:hypothetical protein